MKRILLPAMLLAGCATLYQPPEIGIAEVRVTSLGLTRGTVALDLEVHNPNPRALELLGVTYRLDLQGMEREDGEPDPDEWMLLGEGFHSSGVRVGSEETERVTVELPFEYETVGRTIRSLFRGEDVRYRLEAEVRLEGPVGEIREPVEATGSVLDLRPGL
ncbi:MAG: LEA type 2 family protein [Longimicrobiales bacterium]|nr:LEA type 2 family protein [Longimicrobiales bacterium]